MYTEKEITDYNKKNKSFISLFMCCLSAPEEKGVTFEDVYEAND